MIFDNDKVTTLVLCWQTYRDPEYLDRIIKLSTSLVEAIVAGYGFTHKEDLLQESFTKVIYALPYFDIKRQTLHTFLTTVIRNICYTYLHKEGRQPDNEFELNVDIHGGVFEEPDCDDILDDLMSRNRSRFPSVPNIDDISSTIYMLIVDNPAGKSRYIIKRLVEDHFLDRYAATVIYQSSLAYLRCKYYQHAKPSDQIVGELSLLSDLKELVGAEAYSRVILALSGSYIKIP